eukprot:CAMPEP_0177697838 /NCGR_PEP_ID=MMETSP0484_2-20121128/4726_1 /TAXON_ID=354590 /ORGANISM="Rhodomonas lens, Strain RHODO" /LENGTH=531 /DNA_ID=CAMNT_0019208901 /DNA_START=107 /DNA_END=1699 /DNA_ORIENTATION=+
MGNQAGKNSESGAHSAYAQQDSSGHVQTNTRQAASAVSVPTPALGVGTKNQPYKRPKGTVHDSDSDSSCSSDEVPAATRRDEDKELPEGDGAVDSKKKKYTFHDFEPLKVIGNGCFGKVMMVRSKKDGKIFAMKVIRKAHVVKNKKVRHTQTERNIMQKIAHPFVMRLHYAFQNKGKLYMVMDYLNGGDIFYHLSCSRRFPEERAKFYAAEVLMALECLHEHGFIYRDLKPENVLTDSQGHIRLTDFGLSKEEYTEGAQMNTFVGTTEYLAPEVLKQKGYGKEVDWWSLGVLVFEMLTGCPPFYSKNRQMTFRMILSAELNIPEWLSLSAKSLIRDLLVREPSQRLGSGPKGAADIKRHAWFSSVDFPALYRKEVEPPFRPAPVANDDTSNFDVRFTAKPAEDSPTQSPEDPTPFENFSYQSPTYRDRRMHYTAGGEAGSDKVGSLVGSLGVPVGSSLGKSVGSLGKSVGKGSVGKDGRAKASLPRINSGQDFQDDTPHDAVVVPSAVAEGKETEGGTSSDDAHSVGEEGK